MTVENRHTRAPNVERQARDSQRTMATPTGIEFQELTAVLKRAALARGLNNADAEDVAQEAISRLLTASERLASEAWLPFALTTTSNLIVDAYRREQRDRKHRHRLVERDGSGPELDYLDIERAAAVRAALEGLPLGDRQLLVDHSEGRSTHELAAASQSTPAAIAARLARTRARLRLDYLLALRRVELPTVTCRRVLLAVSAADQRRQQALDAADHVAECCTCTDLIPPLAERRSRLAGIAIAPLIALGTFGGRLQLAAKSHAVQAATVSAAVAAAGAVVAIQTHDANAPHPLTAASTARTIPVRQPAPPALQASSPTVTRGIVETASGSYLLPEPTAGALKAFIGQEILVSDMAVQSVPSHPGFWIGTASQRLYVHIADPAAVLTPVRVGQRVSFCAQVQANLAGFASADGVDPREGSTTLTRQGVHLTVQAANLIITVNGIAIRAS
jgi:RNA polymerase sigma factor (sigma-70 family)